MVGIGTPTVDPDRYRRTWTATAAGNQVREAGGIGNAAVALAPSSVKAMASEMDILKI